METEEEVCGWVRLTAMFNSAISVNSGCQRCTMTHRAHQLKGSEQVGGKLDHKVEDENVWIHFVAQTRRNACPCTHEDEGLHLHLLMLCTERSVT